MNNLKEQVCRRIRDRTWGQVFDQTREPIWNQVYDHVRIQVIGGGDGSFSNYLGTN